MKRKPFLRLLAMLLTVCIVIGLFPTMSVTAYAANEDITLGSAVGTTAEYQFSGATVSSGIKVLNISVNSGNFTLTNATGFTNGVVSSTESHPTAYTGKKYVSVQFTATSGKTAQEALRSIKFKNDGRSQTVTVTGLVDGSITLQGKDILFNGHIYEVSSSRMTWANAMNWSLRMSTYSSVTHHQYPGFEPQPIAIETLLENQVLINLYNAGYRDMWLSAVPKGYDAGNIEYNADTNTVTVTGQPKASGLNSVNYHDDNAGACYRWLLQSESTLPKKSDEMGSCWHRQEPTGAGGPIWFGYGGAYWDDLQPVDWVNATHYAITEWVPSGSAASNSIITETAEITAASINSSVSTLAELNAAIEAVASGTTITLSGDIAGAVTIPADKNITIDLNGHTIDGGNTSNGSGIVNNGTLTLKDSSTSGAGTVKGNYGLTNNGTLTVESGTIEGTGKEGIKNNASATGLTVTGGTIKGADYAICDYDSNGTVRLSNCTLEHTDESGETTENGSGWVIGSWSTYNGGTYIIEEGVLMKNANGNKDGLIHTSATGTAAGNGQVSVSNYSDICFTEGENGYMVVTGAVTTAAELNEAIANGTNPIKLGANISGTVTIPEGKTVVLDLNGHTINGGGSNPGIINNGTLTVKDSGKNGTVTGRYGIKNAGSLTVEGGTLIATGNDGIFNDASATSLTVTGGTIKGKNLAICDYDSDGEVSLSGCTLECTGSGSGSGVGYVLGSYGSNKGGTYTISSDVVMVNTKHTEYLINTSSDGTAAKGSQVSVANYDNTYFASNGDGTYSLAKEVTTAEELEKALADGVKEIKLGADITGPINIPEGYAGTIDLNGHTITATGDGKSAIENKGTLTVKDSSTAGTGALIGTTYGVNNKGVLTVESGKVSGGNAGINIPSQATAGNGIVTVNGGTVEGTAGPGIINDNVTNDDVVLTVEGGTVTGTTAGIKIYNGGTKGDVSVTGGTVTATGTNSSGIDASDATSDVVISVSGGTITGTTNGINNKGTLNVSGGNITGGSDAGDVGINSTGTLNLTGTVKLQDDINGTVTVPAGETANLDLNGHKVSCTATTDDGKNSAHAIDNSGTLTITNSSSTPGEITSTGHGIVNNPDNKDSVAAVLNVNGDSAGDILITGTVHQGITSYAGSDTNIDGATVKGGYYAICDMSGTTGNSVQNAYLERTGKDEIDDDYGTGYVIGAYNSSNGGTWNIADGVVMKNGYVPTGADADPTAYLVNTTNTNGVTLNSTITIAYEKINSGTNAGAYTVKNTVTLTNSNLSDVLSMLSTNSNPVTIKLDGDITGPVTIPAGANVTLDLNGHSITTTAEIAVTNYGTLVVKDTAANSEAEIYGAGVGIKNMDNGKLTVESGAIRAGKDGIQQTANATGATVTVDGGKISGGNNAIYSPGTAGGTITGGYLKADGGSGGAVVHRRSDADGTSSWTISNDGSVQMEYTGTGDGATAKTEEEKYYNNITVTNLDNLAFVEENGVATVYVKVNTIDELNAALGNVEGKDAIAHIVLGDDITGNIIVPSTYTGTIDLNGHTITGANANDNTTFTLVNNGTLTIEDTGATKGEIIGLRSVSNLGNLTLNGVNVTSKNTATTNKYEAIQNGRVGSDGVTAVTTATLTVNGGTITGAGYAIGDYTTTGGTVKAGTVLESTGGYSVLTSHGTSTGGTWTVEDGVVVKTTNSEPINAATGDTASPTEVVVNDFNNRAYYEDVDTDNDGTADQKVLRRYATTAAEIQAAMAANLSPIKLGADITGPVTVPSTYTGTIDLNGHSINTTDTKDESGNVTKYNDSIINNGTLTVKDSNPTKGSDGNITNGIISQHVGIANNGTLTVESGKISGIDGIQQQSNTGTVTVNGGTISGSNSAIYSPGTAGGTINGGYLEAGGGTEKTLAVVLGDSNNKSSWTIANDGSVTMKKADNGTAYFGNITVTNEDELNIVTDEDGVATVYAKVKDTAELQAALDAGAAQIVLSADITGPITVPEGYTGKIDLCGNTISNTKTGAGNYALINKSTEGLTIVDSSEGKAGKITGYQGISNLGTLTLTGITVESSGLEAVQNGNGKPSATLVINGGTITGQGYAIGDYSNTNNEIKGDVTLTSKGNYPVLSSHGNSKGGTWTIGTATTGADGKVTIDASGIKLVTANANPLNAVDSTATPGKSQVEVLNYNNLELSATTNAGKKEYTLSYITNWSNIATAADLKTAIAGVASGNTANIQLSANIDLSDLTGEEAEKILTVAANSKVRIDLNGHTITAAGDKNAFVNNGTLIIQDNSTAGTGAITSTGDAITNNGTMTVAGGNITGASHGINNNGTLNVTGGSITGTEFDGIVNGSTGHTDATVNMSGGTVTGGAFAIYDQSTSTGNVISGGTLESTGTKTWGTPLGSSTTDTKTGGTWDISTDGSVVMKDDKDKLIEVKDVDGNAGGITLAGGANAPELMFVKNSDGSFTVSEVVKVDSEEELINAIANGMTEIELTGNVTLTDTLDIPAGANINLDLNGYTLTGASDKPVIENNGTLTVSDSSTGTGTITGGNIGILNKGDLAVSGGNISGATTGINNSGALDVNGGTVQGGNSGIGIVNSGTATIGGNGQTDDISVSGVIGISNGGTLTVDEATDNTTTITGNGTDGICNLSGATGPVTINGGTVQGYQYAICDYNATGTNTINGGTLERTGTNGVGYVLGSYNDKGGSWTVSEDVVMKNTENDKWICTGVSGNADANGQVTIANFEDITVAGEASGSGYTATVENTGVDTAGKLAAAINSAPDGQATVITLTGDIEGPITIPEGKNIVLDLNGHKITSSTSGINNNGTLTVKDSNPNSASGIVATKIGINNAGTLTVESGKIVGTNHEGISNLSGATKVTVNGGTISGGNFAICDYDIDGTANEVNGGTLIRTKSGNGYVIGSYGSGQGGTWDIADDGSVTMKNTVAGKWVNTPLDGTKDGAPQVSVSNYGVITFDTTAAGKTYTAVVKATEATGNTKVAVVNGDLSFTNMPAGTVEFFAAPSGIASLTEQTAPATGAVVSLTSTEVTAANGSIDLAALSGVDNTDKLGGETPALWVKVTAGTGDDKVEQWFCVGEYESWDEAASSDNTAAKADAVTDSINDMLDLPTLKGEDEKETHPLSAEVLNNKISAIKDAVKNSTDETAIAKAEAKLDVIKSAAEKANAINGNSALTEAEKTALLTAVADAMNTALTAIDSTTDDAAIEEAEAKADAKLEAIVKAADTLTAIDGLSNLSATQKTAAENAVNTALNAAITAINTNSTTAANAELAAAKAEAKMQAELAAAESIDEIMGSSYLSGSETKGDKKALIDQINTAKGAANTAIDTAATESAVTLAAEKLDAKAEVVSEAFSAYTMLNTMSEIENADTFKEKVLAEIDTAFDDIDDETVLAGVNTAKLRGVSAIEDIVVEAAVADLTAAKKAADKAIDKALEAEKAAIEALENLSTEEKASLKSAADAAAAAAKSAIANASTVPAVSDARTNGRNAIELAGDKAEAIAAVNKTAAQKKALADNLTSLDPAAREELKAEIDKAAADAKAAIMNASNPEAIENAKSSAASSISNKVNTAIAENFKAAKGDAVKTIEAEAAKQKAAIDAIVSDELTDTEKAALKAEIDKKATAAITAVKSAANTSAALKAKNDAIADMNVIYAGAVAESDLTAGKTAALKALTAAAEAKKAEIDILTNLTEEEKDIYKSSVDDAVTAAKAAVNTANTAANMSTALANGINNITARVDSAVAEDLANGQSSAKENLSSTADKATTAIDVMGNLTPAEKNTLKEMVEAAEAEAKAEIAEAKTPEAVAAAEEAAASALEVIAAKAEAMDRVSELASEKKAAIEKTLGLTAERKEALKAVVDEQVNAAKADIMDAETKADVLKLKGEFANAYEIGIAYRIIRGAGQTVTKGRYAIFTSDADFSKFIKVQVDGRDLDPANYTAVSGSTKITLNGSYTANLSYGRHTLTIVSVDGEANTYFSIVRFSAHGGDNKDEKPDNESNPSTGAFAPEE